MKRLIGILVLLAAIGAGAWYFFFRQVEQEKPQVVQAAVSQGDIVEQVQATGTLEALRTVQVGSPVSGTVQNLYADFNSIVEQGQVIARIDPSLLQVQVDIQTANIERQETDINQQRVQLENDERSLTRTKELFEKGLVNQTQLEQADLTVKARKAQIASAEKMLVQARANMNQAKLNLSYTEIKSPINGVVVNRIVDVGQTVQASTNTPQFFTIAADLRLLKLTAGVDEADIGKIQPNMRVSFTVDSYAGQTFTGTVSAVRLNAQTTNNVVTYPVWIDVPNVDLKLRPSMTANVRITIQRASGVIRVPNQALRFRPTSDMWTALGLTPPAAAAQGEGRRGRGAAEEASNAAPAAGERAGRSAQGGEGAAASGRQAQQQERGTARGQAPTEGRGQAATAGGGRSGGGQGRGGNANMTPEERERLRQQFQAMGGAEGRSGRGGRGAAGRGGAGGRGTGQQAGGLTPPSGVRTAATATAGLEPLDADKIDELFEPVPVRETPGTVWTWDEAKKELKSTRLVTGLTDGQFSELRQGDLTVGLQLVTSIIVPQTAAQRQQNIFGQQPGGRGGGLQPGGLPGGGGGFGGGGGNPGGGGARGGGGGGRGN